MFTHQNERCAVCDKLFSEDDDIVICHRCGTPHHRACYIELGHCANADRHGEGFEYKPQHTDSEAAGNDVPDSQDSVQNESYSQSTVNRSNCVKCPGCGTEISDSAPFCYHCGKKQTGVRYDTVSSIEAFQPVSCDEDCGEMLDGKSLFDIRCAVGRNSDRFIDKFKSGRKLSWNWSGFLFGAYYLFFRKMYKEGFVAMAVDLIITVFVQGLFAEQINSYYSAYSALFAEQFSSSSSLYSILMGGNAEQMAAIAKELQPFTEAVLPATLILLAVKFVIRFVIAFTSDMLYKSKVWSVIDKTDKTIAEQSNIDHAALAQLNMDMTPKQLRIMYLRKLGTTSIFAPMVAYAALYVITSIISRL